MLRCGSSHGAQRYALIKADQSSTVFYCERQQVQTGQLAGAVHVLVLEHCGIEQTEVVAL
jgi:hypothetical protein